MREKNNQKYHFDKLGEPNRNRFRNMLLIGIVLSLIVFAAIYFFIPEKKGLSTIGNTNASGPFTIIQNNTQVNETFLCDDACFLSLAIEKADSSFCKNISPKRSDECWQMFSNFELSSCLNLKNYSAKKNCINVFINESKNLSLCNYLEGVDKDQCEKKTYRPCINVSESENELCFALTYNDSSYCTKTDCIITYAKRRNDILACDVLSSNSEKYACKSVVTNFDQCSILSGVYTLNYCYQLAAQYSNDYSYCDLITDEGAYQYTCYLNAAIKTGKYSYCAKTGLEYRGKCYNEYSLETMDINGCLAANSTYTTGTADGCLRAFALKFSEPSACNYISSISIKTNCYANTIFQTFNLTIEKCSGIGHQDWKDRCFTETAKIHDNLAICEKILGRDELNRCRAYFIH
ncbi:MAG: hypothetical protein AB1391_03625 [Candidatus Micrarchaeota archaeon]